MTLAHALPPSVGLTFVKGHGTENDFVIVPDLRGTLSLTEQDVRTLCDRRAGLGADGVLRVVLADRDEEGLAQLRSVPGPLPTGVYFMDYRNADGSVAQMCGNGLRVFARYLVSAGLAPAGELQVATRDGVKQVLVPPDGGPISVGMGRAVVGEPVEVDGTLATSVDMGNPHAVLHVVDVDALGTLAPSRTDLNVEYVADVGPRHVAMRVHERGVGETRSCGTGACAAVVATILRTGEPRGHAYRVDVPGGSLEVTWHEDGTVTLTGPAVLVATGETRSEWFAP